MRAPRTERPPLHAAAWWNGPEAAALLLDRDADVEARDEGYGATPLHWAAGGGRTAVAALLLDAGADLEARDEVGWTPLHWAAGFSRFWLVHMEIDRAVEPPSPDVVPPLPTPFMFGREGFLEVTRLLLDRGADLEARNGDGHTPLDLAEANDHPEVAALLRERGARE